MYAIYSDNALIYAPNSIGLGYIVTNPKLTIEVNKAGSLEFTVPITNPSYNLLSKLKSIITVQQDGQEIWRGRILNDDKDFYKNKTVFCEGELAFFNDVVIPPYDYSGGITLRNYFDTLVNYYANHCSAYRRILPGNIIGFDSSLVLNRSIDEYSDIMTELADRLVNELGGYLQLRRQNDKSYLDYIEEISGVGTQQITFGRNLIDLDEYIDASEVYTYIIPLGAADENGNRVGIESVNNGANYVYSQTGENLFGRITRAVAWDDTDDPATLKELGQNLLNSSIEMSTTIEIKAVDLHLLDVDTEALKVGEFVRVVSPPHGIDTQFLCSKIELNLIEPEQSNYNLGLLFTALTDKQVADSKKSDNAYKTAISTAEGYNSLQNEVYENYVSNSEFDSYKLSVDNTYVKKSEMSGYVTQQTFNTFKTTIETLYATIAYVDEQIELVKEMIQGGNS